MGIVYQPPWRHFPDLPEEAARHLGRNFDEITRKFSLAVTHPNFDCLVVGGLAHNDIANRRFKTVFEAVEIMSDLGYFSRLHIGMVFGDIAPGNQATLFVQETLAGNPARMDNIMIEGVPSGDVSIFRPIAPVMQWNLADDTTCNTWNIHVKNLLVYLGEHPNQRASVHWQFEDCIVHELGDPVFMELGSQYAFRGSEGTFYRCGLHSMQLDWTNLYVYDSWISPGRQAPISNFFGRVGVRGTAFIMEVHNCIIGDDAGTSDIYWNYYWSNITDTIYAPSWGGGH